MSEIIQRLKRNFKIKGSRLLLAKGEREHLHVLGQFTSNLPFSRIIGWSKGECSHFLNRKYPDLNFNWQKGFWFDKVDESKLEEVESFIVSQHDLHKEYTFNDEMGKLRKG